MELIECVPNFSEGRRGEVIARIAARLGEVPGAHLLDVDAGVAVNRTVMTIVGSPDAVAEAAFRAVAEAARRIDMRAQRGEHPRIGATDVCPFVPLAGVTLADCAAVATRFAARVGTELGIPCYLYGAAARTPERRELAALRRGGYEALARRMVDLRWKPDFGLVATAARCGATAVGAREPLIAFNVNLATRDVSIARSIAREVREGRGAPPSGLPGCRALGWFIAEYDCCQVTVNVLRYRETGLDRILRRVDELARAQGVRVSGSEVIGLLPKAALLEPGRRALGRDGGDGGRSEAAADEGALLRAAVEALGLDALRPFTATLKVLEYRLAAVLGPAMPRLEI
ncbi:MAG: glutamate formimidoyltransferase [Proteobacteria bacterium]|nr:glutamate formimidoyltransferase [Pseudomonadota bacterium]